jgi:hypothetical protein
MRAKEAGGRLDPKSSGGKGTRANFPNLLKESQLDTIRETIYLAFTVRRGSMRNTIFVVIVGVMVFTTGCATYEPPAQPSAQNADVIRINQIYEALERGYIPGTPEFHRYLGSDAETRGLKPLRNYTVWDRFRVAMFGHTGEEQALMEEQAQYDRIGRDLMTGQMPNLKPGANNPDKPLSLSPQKGPALLGNGYLGPYTPNAYGPGINSDATGRPFIWQPDFGGPALGPIKPNVYGPGIGMDGTGRPVRPACPPGWVGPC